jgi:hypothetical protein
MALVFAVISITCAVVAFGCVCWLSGYFLASLHLHFCALREGRRNRDGSW